MRPGTGVRTPCSLNLSLRDWRKPGSVGPAQKGGPLAWEAEARVMRGGIFPAFVLLVSPWAVMPAASAEPPQRAPACTRTGTAGNDVLTGTSGRDVLCGLGGNDVLKGLAGDDVLRGGGGNDILIGGRGADLITGGTGKDLTKYDDHTAAVVVTIGSLANDGATGEHDDVRADVERVWGGPGADKLTAASVAAELRGLGGADRLTGGAARDLLIGDGGNDYLDGKALGDTYKCGAGTDTYVLGAGDSRTIDCELQAGNQAPNGIGFDGDEAVLEHQPAGTLVDTLNASDPDPGDTLTFSLPAGVFDNELFSISGKQLLTAAVLDHETTPELTLRIRVTDKAGLSFAVTAPVSVLDDGVAPPIPGDDEVLATEDTGFQIPYADLLANDSDPAALPLTVIGATNLSPGLSVFPDAAEFIVDLPLNACGTSTVGFDYVVSNGTETATGHVYLDITCVNDPPVAVDDQVIGVEDTQLLVNISQLLANDTDPDAGTVLQVVSVSGAVNGTAELQPADDRVVFTPSPDFCGTAGFDYQVRDPALTTDVGHVTVLVNCVNDGAPVVPPRSHPVTGNVKIQVAPLALVTGVTDPDGDPFSVTPASGSTEHGGEYAVSSDGSYAYNPPAGFQGTDHLIYQVCDDGAPSLCTAAAVTLTVSDPMWFIDNAAAGVGDGRLTSPYTSLEQFAQANGATAEDPAPGQPIFIDRNSDTPYTGSVVLLPGQKLIGKGSSVPFPAAALVPPPAADSLPLPATGGLAPVIDSPGTAITLANNNTLRGFRVGDRGNVGIAGTNFGTLRVSEVSVVGSGGALELAGGTFAPGASFTEIQLSGTTGGVHLEGTVGDLDLGTGVMASDGTPLSLVNGTGNVTFAGGVLGFGAPLALQVQGWTGQVVLDGLVYKPLGAGISFTASPNASLLLAGGVTLTTTSGAAIQALNGGTLDILGSANTVDATNGPALWVEDSSIGSDGLTFQRLSSASTPSGIRLVDVGGTGRLVVTGTGTQGSGGVITGSGQPGVLLSNTHGPQLSWVTVQNGADDGILASGVTQGLTLDHLTVTGNGNAAGENGIEVANSPGNVTVTNSTFSNSRGHHVIVTTASGGNAVTIGSNTMTTTTTSDGGGIVVQEFAGGSTVQIFNNNIQGAHASAIETFAGGVSLNGIISGNTIGSAAVVGSGSALGSGIRATASGVTLSALGIRNNVVRQYAGAAGIELHSIGTSANLRASFQTNTVGNPAQGASNGLRVIVDGVVGDGGVVCLQANGNTLTGSGPVIDVLLVEQDDSAFQLVGYAGTAFDETAVQAYVSGQNSGATVDTIIESGAGADGFLPSAGCGTP
jgi:hypothetical protein